MTFLLFATWSIKILGYAIQNSVFVIMSQVNRPEVYSRLRKVHYETTKDCCKWQPGAMIKQLLVGMINIDHSINPLQQIQPTRQCVSHRTSSIPKMSSSAGEEQKWFSNISLQYISLWLIGQHDFIKGPSTRAQKFYPHYTIALLQDYTQ